MQIKLRARRDHPTGTLRGSFKRVIRATQCSTSVVGPVAREFQSLIVVSQMSFLRERLQKIPYTLFDSCACRTFDSASRWYRAFQVLQKLQVRRSTCRRNQDHRRCSTPRNQRNFWDLVFAVCPPQPNEQDSSPRFWHWLEGNFLSVEQALEQVIKRDTDEP